MFTGLLHAHSGLRYVVLIAGIAALAWALFGLVTKRPYGRPMRILGAAYAGLLHLQVVLGLVLLVVGATRTEVWIHMAIMLCAAVVAQLPASILKRRPVEERTFGIHAGGILLSLVLIWLALMPFGIGLFGSNAFAP